MAAEHRILVQKGDTPATVKATTSSSTDVPKPATTEQSVVTTPTETIITVKPTVEIEDPFVCGAALIQYFKLQTGASNAQ